MFKSSKIILLILTLILTLSLFACSKTPAESSEETSTDGTIFVSIDTISEVEQEKPSYFKNMDELIEAKKADEDGLFERFETIPLVYINDEAYSLTQIGFYPEYRQVALRYTQDAAFIALIASAEEMPVETDAEVVHTITVCGESVDLYQIGLEQYWGQFDTAEMHIYLKFSIVEDLEAFAQLFEQGTLAELMQASAE